MKGLTVVVLWLSALTAAWAGPFSDIVVFGDSLSDNGNLYAVTSSLGIPEPPSPPYYNGRFSNGPVAVEDVAAHFGVPLLDFAYGGATTGLGNSGDGGSVASLGIGLPGMTTQFQTSKPTIAPLASSSVFIVWGGPNDLLAPAPGDAGDPAAIANTAAANIIGIVNGIEAAGGKQILVPGVPDLALAPDYSSNTAAVTLFATTLNNDLINGLPAGATYVDTFNFLKNLANNGSQYGFTNVTSPCLNGSTPCADPNQYLFWDGKHPTAAAQELLALDFEQDLQPVPEPNPALLTFTILVGLAAVRRYGWR